MKKQKGKSFNNSKKVIKKRAERAVNKNNDKKSEMNLQWYPGHMAKTRRMITENLKLCDAVAEILDSRIPISSKNPDIDDLIVNKPRFVILNKSDISDSELNKKWQEYYRSKGFITVLADCSSGRGFNKVKDAVYELMADKIKANEAKGMKRTIKLMVLGIPNVGKSSFINRAARGAKVKVEDRPGVTRTKQWIRLDDGLELLDMPGILWPKFEDENVGLNLAFTGAIKDDIMDIETLACKLIGVIKERYAENLCARYNLEKEKISDADDYEILEYICKKRGFLISGGAFDTERGAKIFLDEFRDAKIGKITLESI